MEEMAKLWTFLRRHNGIYLQANIIYWKDPSGNFGNNTQLGNLKGRTNPLTQVFFIKAQIASHQHCYWTTLKTLRGPLNI